MQVTELLIKFAEKELYLTEFRIFLFTSTRVICMLAFSEMLKSLTPIKSIKEHGGSVRKLIFEKLFDLVLIVLSIYIALAVERLAEGKNEKERLLQYYENIEQELEKDISALDSCIIVANGQIAQQKTVLHQLAEYTPQNKDSISSYMAQAISVQLFSNSQMLSYKSMVSSGDLRLIKNLSVKEQFASLEEKYNALKLYEDYTIEFLKKEFTPLVNQNYDLLHRSALMNPALYTDYKFKNSLVLFYSLNITRRDGYVSALLKARETKALLQKEIEQGK